MTSRRVTSPVIVLPMSAVFAQIDAVLIQRGWQRDDTRATGLVPIVAGEPELVTWKLYGRRPSVTYTFNPAVGLRVLDLAQLEDAERDDLARVLPHVGEADVRASLNATDPRVRLHGLFAAQALGLVHLQPEVARLRDEDDEVVARAAAATQEVLATDMDARTLSAAALGLLAGLATPLLRLLATSDGAQHVAALKPSASDIAALFVEEVANDAATVYAAMWRTPPKVAAEHDVRVDVYPCPAGMLREDNELSRPFPQGYRPLAPYLVARHVWFCWRYAAPGSARGVLYDGLVRLDERWVWCPTPYRVVGELLARRGHPIT